MSFAKIDADAIAKCEEFSRTKLAERFDQQDHDLKHFFGSFYAANPTQLVFHDGDKTLIEELVKRMQDQIQKDGNYQY